MSCLLFVGTATVNAQDKTTFTEDGYIFFINGSNVLIPNLDGATSVDPLDPTSDNLAYRINFGNWAESGFRWNEGAPDSGGVDMTALIGDNYGESDTLFVRFLADTANANIGNFFLAMFDTRTGLEYGTDNLPFRCLWYIPMEMRDGNWHELALPLPPATRAALDSAQAGKKLDGTDLDVEVDSLLLANWSYPGAWANGVGVFDPADAEYKDFEWNAVAKFGVFWDVNGGGGPIYFDYYSIGVPPSELVDNPPAQASNISATAAEGVNTITWDAVNGAAGYNVYFSESTISSITADGVVLLGSFDAEDARSQAHEIVAPHPSLASGFTAHYAVTSKSPFGAESAPAPVSVTGDTKVAENYAVELDQTALDAVFDAISAAAFPDQATLAGFFPEGYAPFEISSTARLYQVNGTAPENDADISGKWWVGFGSELNELILYTEIMDDTLRYAPVGASRNEGGGAAWNFDNYEMGLTGYQPESFIIGSTHSDILRGEAPDYQYRIGNFIDAEPFTFESWHVDGGAEIGGSQTITAPLVDGQDTVGYRLLTLYDTANLSNATNEDALIDFPAGTEVHTYAVNFALNDNDGVSRARQIAWSKNTGTADDWWNTPARWEVVAFVGKDAVATSAEDVQPSTPYEFALDQNYPNPFNPSTNIQFSLRNATSVTIEVFNMLGQRVATLANSEMMSAGVHSISFDASNLASGLYLYRLSTPEFVGSKKMMLIK